MCIVFMYIVDLPILKLSTYIYTELTYRLIQPFNYMHNITLIL